MAEGGTESGSSFQKAILILDALFESDLSMGLAEQSQHLNLPRQTVHLVVCQLEDLHIIRRDFACHNFSVGARMTRLSLNAKGVAWRMGSMRAAAAKLQKTLLNYKTWTSNTPASWSALEWLIDPVQVEEYWL